MPRAVPAAGSIRGVPTFRVIQLNRRDGDMKTKMWWAVVVVLILGGRAAADPGTNAGGGLRAPTPATAASEAGR
ncbi:hypothetical protein DAERI_020325 [Deinococcus aerius]|uniref:Uncharacterized protein n=1 Tax=Deinococcus aerius TaxID=200253 RepID=A0A2I9DFA8_9DEIO|nr:hypothetical protein DAERI_020325 [Deinococcus aerius]